jgi:hypothetical protein
MSPALFWGITQQMVVLLTDVSGQPIGSIFRFQEISRRGKLSFLDFFTFESMIC